MSQYVDVKSTWLVSVGNTAALIDKLSSRAYIVYENGANVFFYVAVHASIYIIQ